MEEKAVVISMGKLWQKGYSLNREIEAFTVGDDYLLDQKLLRYDCQASIAHAKMLGKIGILKTDEVRQIIGELQAIIELDTKGKFLVKREDEDCHTAIENHLTKKLGEVGKKIHTARSRNDQVLTALRLYYKDEIHHCRNLVQELVKGISALLRRYGKVALPGYTHTRKAMPSSIGLWGASFMDSMHDNLKILDLALELMDQSPLGTGAGYGVPLEIDREYTAKLLGFKKVQENPIYAQNSRGKLEATMLHALTQIMLDLNRMATDLILFSMPEFGYFELPEELCTGSSIMPHKKNPDVLELVRGRYSLLASLENQIKQIIANLPSGYHRDLQLTKEPAMRGLQMTEETLSIMSLVLKHLKANRERCREALTDEVFATERVYQLVKKGVPFREAYRRVSKAF